MVNSCQNGVNMMADHKSSTAVHQLCTTVWAFDVRSESITYTYIANLCSYLYLMITYVAIHSAAGVMLTVLIFQCMGGSKIHQGDVIITISIAIIHT